MNKDLSQKLFESLLGADNIERKEAEVKFNKLKDLPFQESIQVFLTGVGSNNTNVQTLAILLMKKTYVENKENYSLLSPTDKIELKKLMYSLVVFDKDINVLCRIADFLAKLYSYEDLPELLTYVVKTFNSENSITRRFSIYTIEAICELGILNDSAVEGSIDNFNIIFKAGNSP